MKLAYGRELILSDARERKQVIRIGSNRDVYLHVLLTRLFDLQGFGSYFATKQFIRTVKKYDPDLIHIHNIHGSYVHVGSLFHYFRKYNKTVIWTLHDCFAYTGHCAHYTNTGCMKWKTGCGHCPQKKLYPASYFLDRSQKNFRKKKKTFCGLGRLTVTTVSRWLGEEAKQSFLTGYPIKVIPNGIDLSVFRPVPCNFRKKYHLENRKVILGVSSVWNEGKGIRMFNGLAEELGEDFQIVLVGVEKKSERLFSPKILCVERTENQHKLAEFYAAADLFLNASKEESFGLVSLEALACGTPVITNTFTANPELVDESCGIVVEDYTVQAYAKAVVWLTNHPVLPEACVNRAIQYDEARMYQKYIELYEEVIL